MEIQLPPAVKTIIEQLNSCGFEAYAVGGCVRDSLLKREPKDWDVTTSAKPDQIKAVFGKTIDTGIQHGTVTVLQNRIGYEVTTYRIDGEYEDSRHPKSVEFTQSLSEDLKRRDFTINAMAYNDKEGLLDPFYGMQDLKKGIIRCVGNPLDRFREDALRILRAVRFSAQLDFIIEEETKGALSVLAPNLTKISRERIQEELTKLLLSAHPEKLLLVQESNVSTYISGELEAALKSLSHPEKLGLLPAKKHMRWAGLLRERDFASAVLFLRELKMDNKTVDQVKTLVSLWKTELVPEKPALRRQMSRLSLELYRDLLHFQNAFCKESYQKQLGEVERLSEEIRQSGDCIGLKDMAVNGGDLIRAGMKPGPDMGSLLNRLFEEVLEVPERNTREYLLKRAGEFSDAP